MCHYDILWYMNPEGLQINKNETVRNLSDFENAIRILNKTNIPETYYSKDTIAIISFEKDHNVFLVSCTGYQQRCLEVTDYDGAFDSEIKPRRPSLRFKKNHSHLFEIPIGQEKEFIERSRLAMGIVDISIDQINEDPIKYWKEAFDELTLRLNIN